MAKILFASLALILTSCGQPVCVAGFGQCDGFGGGTTTTTGGVAPGTLFLDSAASTVAAGATVNISVSGGNPPYMPKVVVGTGGFNVNLPTSQTSFGFQAPSTPQTVQLNCTDSSSPVLTSANLSITVTPH